MRIGLIAPPWLPVPPITYGGTESVVDRLARGFLAAGHEVTLCTVQESTCPVPRHGRFAQPTEHIGALLPELNYVLDAHRALAEVDVVHDHTLLGALTRPRSDQPVVVTNHGPFDASLQEIFSAIAATATVIAISRAQAATAAPGTVGRVIHHGIDVDRVVPGSGRGGCLAFLGRMSPTKGVAEAIDIARACGLPLRIAAKCREPQEQSYFNEAIRPRLGERVEYIGEISEAERETFLGDALALLNPIQWEEPFGLVMIEALAAGTPVLALDKGAAPEVVEHGVTGLLAHTPEGLVRAIGRLDEISRSACRGAAESRFATGRMVDDHLDLFEHLIAGSASTERSMELVGAAP